MAQKPMGTEAAERMNFVAQDAIWRYRLKAENEARQNWAQNWGFLTTPLEELIQHEEEAPTPKPKMELPQRFRIRPVTPVEKFIKLEGDSKASLCVVTARLDSSVENCCLMGTPVPPGPKDDPGLHRLEIGGAGPEQVSGA
ncbi:ciliary microtubule inner protein 1 isoform X1 [Pteropus medius]|uniref:uncharacterized protein C20orf85 homolog isoform X1 n=1 Tax=Pteropus vampyrus TaxID=132908 RepID=UPI00196A6EEE|nr:uncharacterized protein C20orf85 homolog isoform X1 [Pteropus giganteus]